MTITFLNADFMNRANWSARNRANWPTQTGSGQPLSRIFDSRFLRAGAFFAVRLRAGAFLAVVFFVLAVARAVVVRAGAFLAGAFFAAVLRAVVFVAVVVFFAAVLRVAAALPSRPSSRQLLAPVLDLPCHGCGRLRRRLVDKAYAEPPSSLRPSSPWA